MTTITSELRGFEILERAKVFKVTFRVVTNITPNETPYIIPKVLIDEKALNWCFDVMSLGREIDKKKDVIAFLNIVLKMSRTSTNQWYKESAIATHRSKVFEEKCYALKEVLKHSPMEQFKKLYEKSNIQNEETNKTLNKVKNSSGYVLKSIESLNIIENSFEKTLKAFDKTQRSKTLTNALREAHNAQTFYYKAKYAYDYIHRVLIYAENIAESVQSDYVLIAEENVRNIRNILDKSSKYLQKTKTKAEFAQEFVALYEAKEAKEAKKAQCTKIEA